MKTLYSGLFFGILLVSCTPKNTVQVKEISKEDTLEKGKLVFENACGKCHALPKPTAYTSVQWVGIMNAMAPKSKLSQEQHKWVYDYLVSVKE